MVKVRDDGGLDQMMEVKIERSSRYILGVELAGSGMDWIGHDDRQGDVQDVCQFSSLGTSSMKAHLLDFPLTFSSFSLDHFHTGPLLYLITPKVISSNPTAVNSISMLTPKLTPLNTELTT